MRILLTLLLSSLQTLLFCQGISGTILNEEDEPMPFATIYVREINNGTASNADGLFRVDLAPGVYTVTFQYMGYKTITRQISVEDSFKEVSVKMEPQVIVLQDVRITAGKEDPAYTIMRKAIAKAKFHTQYIDR